MHRNKQATTPPKLLTVLSHVSASPLVSVVHNTVTCDEDQLSCTMECIVTGTPTPTVIWTRSGQSTVLSGQAKYVIPGVKRGQEGTYKCTATNQFGSDDKDVSLIVNCEFVFLKSQSNNVLFAEFHTEIS